jgi:hypothetical protein
MRPGTHRPVRDLLIVETISATADRAAVQKSVFVSLAHHPHSVEEDIDRIVDIEQWIGTRRSARACLTSERRRVARSLARSRSNYAVGHSDRERSPEYVLAD